MIGEIKHKKEVQLGDEMYLVYIKEVASKLSDDGTPEKTATRAFIKRLTE